MPSARTRTPKRGSSSALTHLALIAVGLIVVVITAQSSGMIARLLEW